MKALLFATTGFVIAAAPAWAQQAPQADEGAIGASDIVVTARRTEERLRDVPLAVTALSNQALSEQGIKTVADLAKVSPGLSVSAPNTDPFSPVVSMRGQVQNDITLLALDTSVGFYVDDFYISRPNALIAYGSYDLERVEVSRGPQGTLFGRNATGGNVRFITRKAGGAFEGYIRGSYGNFDRREIEGAINLPLAGDRLAVRVAGLTVSDNGYGKGLNPALNPRRYGDANNNALRVNAIARPSETVMLDFSWNHFDGKTGNQLARSSYFMPGVAALYPVETATALGLTYKSPSNLDHFADATNDLYTAMATIDLNDNLQFSAIYGHMDIDVDQQFDLMPLGPLFSRLTTRINSSQDSAEARLSGQFLDGRLQLQTGVYWLKESGATDLNNDLPVAGVGAASNISARPINTARNRSLGVFAQGTAELTPQLKLTLGGRYTDERRVGTSQQFTTIHALGVTVCGLNTDPASPTYLGDYLVGSCLARGIKKDDYFSYLASLDFKPADNHLIYVKTAKGYRAGGYNPRGTASDTFAPFDPESVTEYEIGYKGRLLDGRLNLNVAGFVDQRRKGQQSIIVTSPQTGASITLMDNVVNLDVHGLEVEANARVTDFLSVDAAYTYLDKRLQLSSQHRLNLGMTLTGRVGDGTLTARGSYSYQSDFDSIVSGCLRGADFRKCSGYVKAVSNVAGYGLLNGRIAYKLDEPHLEFAVFGRNLANKAHDLFKFDNRGGGGGIAYVGAPRTYGMEIRYGF